MTTNQPTSSTPTPPKPTSPRSTSLMIVPGTLAVDDLDLETREQTLAAWREVTRPEAAENYTADELAALRAEIARTARSLDLEVGD